MKTEGCLNWRIIKTTRCISSCIQTRPFHGSKANLLLTLRSAVFKMKSASWRKKGSYVSCSCYCRRMESRNPCGLRYGSNGLWPKPIFLTSDWLANQTKINSQNTMECLCKTQRIGFGPDQGLRHDILRRGKCPSNKKNLLKIVF